MADKRYAVTLSGCGNPDHGQNPYKSVYGVPTIMRYADTIEELQEIVKTYIRNYNLGGGNWTGGIVYDAINDIQIGHISYNGRYWEETDAKEDDE